MAAMTPIGADWVCPWCGKQHYEACLAPASGWGSMPNWAHTQDAKEERAAIMEYDGKLSRHDAETAAGVKPE